MTNKNTCLNKIQSEFDCKFTRFFIEYTQEGDDSPFIQHYDPNMPYAHMAKHFFTDVLLLQTEQSKNDEVCGLYFIPVLMLLRDKSGQGVFWKLNHPEVATNYVNTTMDQLAIHLKGTYKSYNSKELIAELVDLQDGLFVKMLYGPGDRKRFEDINIDDGIISKVASCNGRWHHLFDQQDVTDIDSMNSYNTDIQTGVSSYIQSEITYEDTAKNIFNKLIVVTYLANTNQNEGNCNCFNLFTHDVQFKALFERLYTKIFAINSSFEKNTRHKAMQEQLAIAQEKEQIYSNIHAPLKEMIDHLTSTTYLVTYLNRQLNPSWMGLLKLAEGKKMVKIYDKKQLVEFTGMTPFEGLHDFDAAYNEKNHKSFIDNVINYYHLIITHVDNKKYGSYVINEDNDKAEVDILVLVYGILNHIKDYKVRYELLRFIKHIAYDSQDEKKKVSLMQILLYTSLAMNKINCCRVSYYIDDEITSDNFTCSLKPVDFLNLILKEPIYNKTIDHYHEIHNNRKCASVPNVKLSGNVSAADFCGALARLIGDELQGSKEVISNSVEINSLGEGAQIGVTIKCSGVFKPDSFIKQIDDDVSKSDVYHGMRDAIKVIEKAVGQKRKLSSLNNLNLQDCFHPFVIYSLGSKTIIRIILGDIYSPLCGNYSQTDFIKRDNKHYVRAILGVSHG